MVNEKYMLGAAGLVWLIFIIVGIIGRPVKMTPVVSVGGGFLAAAITLAIVGSITQFFLKNGVQNGILIILFFLLFVCNAIFGILGNQPIILILANTLTQIICCLIFWFFIKIIF